MVIGILQVELAIHGAESIKDKRRVVHSLRDRLHREHLVSVAEVGNADRADRARLAIALAGADGRRVGEVLDAITGKVRAALGAELMASRRQIIREEQIADLEPGEEPDVDAINAEMRSRAAEAGLAEDEA